MRGGLKSSARLNPTAQHPQGSKLTDDPGLGTSGCQMKLQRTVQEHNAAFQCWARAAWEDFLTSSEFKITSKIKCEYTHIFPVSAFLQPYTSPNPPLPIILCTLKSFMVSCKCKKQSKTRLHFSALKPYCKNT